MTDPPSPQIKKPLDLEELRTLIADLARLHNLAEAEVAARLIDQALSDLRQQTEFELRWETLSPRQKEIAGLAAQGLTNRQIAARLYLSPETVKTHLSSALQRLNIPSRIDLKHTR